MNTQGTIINPYLSFLGNCREAMEFYRDTLGGKLEIQTYAEAPMKSPEEFKDKILHSRLELDGAILMAADTQPGQEVRFGNAVTVSLALNGQLEKATKAFETLSEGGVIIMPFGDTFWGARFGMFTDKFGINWMLHCELEQK